MGKEPRLVLSIIESQELLAEHISRGQRLGEGIPEHQYATWHSAAKIAISRIFSTRDIPKRFDVVGGGPIAFLGVDARNAPTPTERLQRELDFLKTLRDNLRSYRPVGRAIR